MKYVNMVEPSPVRSHIFDVGANKGMFTRKCLERFPNCKYHLFEPVPHLTRRIVREDPRAVMNYVGVSNRAAQGLEFYIRKGHTSNSFKKTTDAYEKAVPEDPLVDQIRVDAIRVDEYCRKNQVEEIFILKVDVEGMGLEVLEGCGEMLQRTQWVGIEIHKIQLFAGGDDEERISRFLSERGFRRFVDIYAHFSPASGELIGVDTLWENTRFKIVENDFYHLNAENSMFRELKPAD